MALTAVAPARKYDVLQAGAVIYKTKQPADIVIYGLSWANFIDGATTVSSQVISLSASSGTPAVIGSSGFAPAIIDGNTSIFMVSGGDTATIQTITVTATFSNGEVKKQILALAIKEV